MTKPPVIEEGTVRVQPDSWNTLRRFTPARIGLGRAGGSIPTSELLKFQLAHARARDAVHHSFDIAAFLEELRAKEIDCLALSSAAGDRQAFIQRPDQRDVVALRIIAGLSLEETAAATGKKVGAVTQLQRRGLASLRRILDPQPITP